SRSTTRTPGPSRGLASTPGRRPPTTCTNTRATRATMRSVISLGARDGKNAKVRSSAGLQSCTHEGRIMKTKLFRLAIVAALVAAVSPSLIAHHAFGAEFDANRPVLLKGKVTKLEWVNPHAWIHITVTCAGPSTKPDDPVCVGKKAGDSEEWMV